MCYMTTMLIPHTQPGSSAAYLEFFNPPQKNMAILETLNHHHNPSKEEVLKPFPFTNAPTITNNSPSGALILEIIFSNSDSNGTAGPTNSLDDESDAEEDESDDDVGDSSDSEDDSGDNNYQGESDEEEEEEEDEDEDDNEEDDNNEDEEEYEPEEADADDNDSEDFNTSFEDDDLIIDFSNGTEDNEEDGLVIEFEDTSIPEHSTPSKSPAKTITPKVSLPFWFTNEEQDQIQMIFESYSETMDIEEQRKQCIRSPAPFVGRVVRTPLKPTDHDNTFKTLDKVEVYLRELYPLGTILPLSRTAWVLTTWDKSDGVPTHSVELSKSSKKSMQKQLQTGQSSTLYCAPIFMTKEDYQYTVSPIEHSLMYASSSSTNASISRISPFIPAHCRNISFSLD